MGNWITAGTHINAVGSSTALTRELDTATIAKSKLFTDCYESLFNEAGDFIIPKKEGVVTDSHVKGDLGEGVFGVARDPASEPPHPSVHSGSVAQIAMRRSGPIRRSGLKPMGPAGVTDLPVCVARLRDCGLGSSLRTVGERNGQ